MPSDRGGKINGIRHAVSGIPAGIPEPREIKIVVSVLELPPIEEAKPTFFSAVLALRLPERICAEGFLEAPEVAGGDRMGLAESVHVRAHVVNPSAFRVALVSLPAREEDGRSS